MSKRDKQLARARAVRQQQRRAERAASKKIRNRVVGSLVVIASIAAVGIALSRPSGTPAAAPTASASAAPSSLVADCQSAPAIRADNLSFAKPGTAEPATKLNLITNCGSLEIALDSKAPTTVANMSFLAQSKFFDLTACHRVTTSGLFVLQCGDPASNGSGGPGYKFADENLPAPDAQGNAVYPAGTVAMANSGPDTNGSQFFIVYKDTTLPAKYSVWGKVTSGLDWVNRVAAAGVMGSGTDGPPAQPVVITQAITS